MNNQILKQLDSFISKDKFSASEWSMRGLIPTSVELCIKMSDLVNECANELRELVTQDASKKMLEKALVSCLKRFETIEYDTEEKEIIGDYIYELSQILKIDITNAINKWMYGFILATMMKVGKMFKSQEQIVQTLSQDCTKCNAKLETFITKRPSGFCI